MKALIIANGKSPSKKLIFKHKDAELLIAADGGIRTAMKYGLNPDFIIGDFDSAVNVPSEVIQKSTVVRLSLEKNETDGMVAIDTAIQNGAMNIVMLGALGKRTDHAVANLMLLKYAWYKGAALTLEDEYCEITLATGKTVVKGKKGQTVSVLPFMGSATVTSDKSLHYPMDKLYMNEGNPVGISNILEKTSSNIFIEGYAMIFKIK